MVERLVCLIVVGLLTGCSTSSDQSDDASTQPTEPTITSDAETERSSEESVVTLAADEDTSEASSSLDPVRPYDRDTPPTTSDEVSKTAYVSRISMSDTSIEMHWSTSDGAVEYHLHRLPRSSDDKPEAEAMTAENMIHVADDSGRFTDDGVEAGTRYWYGLRALADDGGMVAHGWHRADAVTDNEPPALVGDLTAIAKDGEVLVSWTKPDENYELHGYRILRSIDGQEPESMATTWRIEQTSFVDDRPPSAANATYSIVAFDFHWNDSAPAEVDVELP